MQRSDPQLVSRFHSRQRLLKRASLVLLIPFFGSILLTGTEPPIFLEPTSATVFLVTFVLFAVYVGAAFIADRCPKCKTQLWGATREVTVFKWKMQVEDPTKPYPERCPKCGLRLVKEDHEGAG